MNQTAYLLCATSILLLGFTINLGVHKVGRKVHKVHKVCSFKKKGAKMVSPSDDRLTPGTFFVLLQQALRQRKKARQTLSGSVDGLSNPNLLAGLIRIVDPSFETPHAGKTFNQATSSLRNCKNVGAMSYMPVGSEDFTHCFNTLINHELVKGLDRTAEFLDQFIDVENKGERLVCDLLTVLNRDLQIDPQTQILFLPRKCLTKSEVLTSRELCVEAFVLGLWYYVSTKVLDNREGRKTFERWHPGLVADKAAKRFNRSVFAPQTYSALSVIRMKDGPTMKNPEDIPIVEAEIIDEEPGEQTSNQSSNTQPHQAATLLPNVVFNQYGDNSQQFGSVETVVIGNRGRK